MPGSTPRKRNFVNASNFASLNKINAIGNLSLGSLVGKKSAVVGGAPPVTPTISDTPTNTPTISLTPSITPTYTSTPSITPSSTPSVTNTLTPTTTITPSVTITNTKTPSPTPFVTPTNTRTPTTTPSLTPNLSQTPTPSITPSNTPTSSITPSITPTYTVTPSVTLTQTPSITPTNTPTVSNPVEYILYSVGYNDHGQLGIGSTNTQTTLSEITFPSSIDYLSVGLDHVIVGQVGSNFFYGAGNNNFFQLGLSSNVEPLPDNRTSFTLLSSNWGSVPSPGNWKYIIAGCNYSMAVSATDNNLTQLWYVGDGRDGQLGNRYSFGTSYDWLKSDYPLGNIKLCKNEPISLASTFEGSAYVYGCGLNYDKEDLTSRVQYVLNYAVSANPVNTESYNWNVLLGTWNSFDISSGAGGSTLMFGTSSFGDPYQWYYMGTFNGILPVALSPTSLHTSNFKFKKIVAGTSHLIALSADSKIAFGLGSNVNRELGLPLAVNYYSWTQLDGEWDDIYASGYCSWAKMANTNDWYACGLNIYGQLAINSPATIVNVFSGPIPINNIIRIESNGNSTYLIAPKIAPTPTPTTTVTPTNTFTPTPSITPSITPTNTITPSITPSITESITPTPSETPSSTETPTPTVTSSITPTPSITPSITPEVTPSPTPSTTPLNNILTNIYSLSTNSALYQNNGTVVSVSGYYSNYDGGEGKFTFDSTSLSASDGGAIICPSNITPSSPGRWKRIFNDNIAKVEMWGAKGDGITDDAPSIAKAVDFVSLNQTITNNTINFDSKTYLLSTCDTKGQQVNGDNDFYISPYICIGYYPNSNYKFKINLIGTGNTILCATNVYNKTQNGWDKITWEDGVTTIVGSRMMVSLRDSVTGCLIKGITFYGDDYPTSGDASLYITKTGELSSYPNGKQYCLGITGGIEIGSNKGTGWWGEKPLANIREYVHIHDCNLINVHDRSINCSSAVAPGSGTQLVTITGCQFLYPKGSNSKDIRGGNQATLFASDTRKLIFSNNYAEGTSKVPVDCPTGYPVDGIVIGAALDTIISNNTFERFGVETLYLNSYSPAYWLVEHPTNNKMPAVGNSTILQLNVPRNIDYSMFCSATASILTPGSYWSAGYSFNATGAYTGGIYLINSIYGTRPDFYLNVTRVSGANFGDEFMVSRDAPIGTSLSGKAISLFNFTKLYNQNNKVIDNVFTLGYASSATPVYRIPWPNGEQIFPNRFAHDTCLRTDGFQNYLSGNIMTSMYMANDNRNPGATTIIENNKFYKHNVIPRLAGPSDKTPYWAVSAFNSGDGWGIAISMSGAVIKNNEFYYWKNTDGSNATAVASAFPMVYYNCGDFYPGSANLLAADPYPWCPDYSCIRFFGVELNYAIPISIPQSFYDNSFYCSIPLSANLIQPAFQSGGVDVNKTVYNNNIIVTPTPTPTPSPTNTFTPTPTPTIIPSINVTTNDETVTLENYSANLTIATSVTSFNLEIDPSHYLKILNVFDENDFLGCYLSGYDFFNVDINLNPFYVTQTSVVSSIDSSQYVTLTYTNTGSVILEAIYSIDPVTPTPTPTLTPSITPEATPTLTPEVTPSSTLPETPTPTPTPSSTLPNANLNIEVSCYFCTVSAANIQKTSINNAVGFTPTTYTTISIEPGYNLVSRGSYYTLTVPGSSFTLGKKLTMRCNNGINSRDLDVSLVDTLTSYSTTYSQNPDYPSPGITTITFSVYPYTTKWVVERSASGLGNDWVKVLYNYTADSNGYIPYQDPTGSVTAIYRAVKFCYNSSSFSPPQSAYVSGTYSGIYVLQSDPVPSGGPVPGDIWYALSSDTTKIIKGRWYSNGPWALRSPPGPVYFASSSVGPYVFPSGTWTGPYGSVDVTIL